MCFLWSVKTDQISCMIQIIFFVLTVENWSSLTVAPSYMTMHAYVRSVVGRVSSGANYLSPYVLHTLILSSIINCSHLVYWTLFSSLFYVIWVISIINDFFYEAASLAFENKYNWDRWREKFHQRVCRLFPTWSII